MFYKNYYVGLAESWLKAGETIEQVTANLNKMADNARLRGAWPVWNTICEAMVILGI